MNMLFQGLVMYQVYRIENGEVVHMLKDCTPKVAFDIVRLMNRSIEAGSTTRYYSLPGRPAPVVTGRFE